MPGVVNSVRRAAQVAVIFASLAFAGCSITPAPIDVPPAPEPVQPDVVETQPTPKVQPKKAVKLPAPPSLPPIAIVLTSNQPAYADVATALTEQFDETAVYNLADDSRPPVTILRMINDADNGVVVAIGLRAAMSSVAMSNSPVVFSQVFNYQDHDILTENSRGVAAIAPLDAQIAAWKEINPSLSRIGAIIGEGHDDLIAEAELAAARHDVDLRIQVTRSDQETLYFFKRMIRDIDGFWLFPDNRVLSQRALQQIMTEANDLRVPVMVPSDPLLKLGGSISVTSVATDIAATITKVVRQIVAGDLELVPAITQLSEIRVKTKDQVQVVER